MTIALPLVNVLFGTVTGNAEEIARRIHGAVGDDDLLRQGVLLNLSQYADVPAFEQASARAGAYNVVVVSTTGDGDAPDTIRPFMKLLRSKDKTRLDRLQYTVLALGDTNYENFCNTGKKVDASLAKLGASRFHPRGDADDGVGLELVVEPWISALFHTLHSLDLDLPVDQAHHQAHPVASLPPAALEDVVRLVTAEQLGFDAARLPKLPPSKFSVASVSDNSHTPAKPPSPPSLSPSYDADAVVPAVVTAAHKMSADTSDRVVWHVALRLSRPQAYRPGDAFGVLVSNLPQDIARFFSTFPNLDPSELVHVTDPKDNTIGTDTLRRFVADRLDLRATPSKTLLRALAAHCEESEHARTLFHLCSRDGRSDYRNQVSKASLSLLDVVEKLAPSCRPPLQVLLDLVSGIPPRWYSAASSPSADGHDVVHFAFSVVPDGLATTALAARAAALLAGEAVENVLLLPRDSDADSRFRPPSSLSTPYIMIGPGTGVAPFRGFLRERRREMDGDDGKAVGKTMLFFGCRTPDEDYLYREELQSLEHDGVLSTLDVAFSRQGPEKVYVQHRLQERQAEVARLLRDGGSVFVCGDGGGMAKSVHDALVPILSEELCDGDLQKADTLLRSLAREDRYVRDIWFHG